MLLSIFDTTALDTLYAALSFRSVTPPLGLSFYSTAVFGVRVSQCRKPLVPNNFGIIPNCLEFFQIIWYHTKEISQGGLNLTSLARL